MPAVSSKVGATLKLNNGLTIPTLGLGTWKAEPGEVGAAVYHAIKSGYRHIDCAAVYKNEKEVGAALKRAFDEKLVSRKDLFVTSKVWNTMHRKDRVKIALTQTLGDLGLDYLDLYLIHFPVALKWTGDRLEGGIMTPKDGSIELANDAPLHETWKALEEEVESGKIKSIGVSNYTIPVLADVLNYCKIKPVTNQIEVHPYNTRQALIDFCHKNGITVTAYSPLGSGKQGPLQDALVVKLAKQYSKSAGQILIRWSLQKGLICIPKSANEARIEQNWAVFDFELSDAEVGQIDALERKLVVCSPAEYWSFDLFAA